MKGENGFLKYNVIKAVVVVAAGICIVALPFFYMQKGEAFTASSANILY